MAEREVWVEDWQMQCCGEPFSVGDVVHWTAAASVGVEELEPILGKAVAASIGWVEDHHDLAVTEAVTGTVRSVRAVFYRARVVDRVVLPVAGSGVLVPKSHVSGWEENDDLRFLGYIVTLT